MPEDQVFVSRRNVLRGSAATIGIGALAGCQDNDQQNTGTSPADTAQQATQGIPDGLVARAKEEGTLVFASTTDAPALNNDVIPAFEEAYPWAEVKGQALAPGDVTSKIQTEYQTGNVTYDAVANTRGTMAPLTGSDGPLRQFGEDGAVMDYVVNMMNYPESMYDSESRYWMPKTTYPLAVMYNTDNLSREEVPSAYEELANDKWDGRLAFDRPQLLGLSGGLFASLYGVWDESKWQNVMQGIADNNPMTTQSSSNAYRAVVQGQRDIAPATLLTNIRQGIDEDSPIDAYFLEPAVSLNAPSYVTKDAPHPAMGELMCRFWASFTAADAFKNSQRMLAHPAAQAYYFPGAVPKDVNLRPVGFNTPTFFTEPNTWEDRFAKYFG